MNDLKIGDYIVFNYGFENDIHNWIGKIIQIDSRLIYIKGHIIAESYYMTASFYFNKMSDIKIIDEMQYLLMSA